MRQQVTRHTPRVNFKVGVSRGVSSCSARYQSAFGEPSGRPLFSQNPHSTTAVSSSLEDAIIQCEALYLS